MIITRDAVAMPSPFDAAVLVALPPFTLPRHLTLLYIYATRIEY